MSIKRDILTLLIKEKFKQLFILICVCFFSCTNSPNHIPFPQDEAEFSPPKNVNIFNPSVILSNNHLASFDKDSSFSVQIKKLGKPNVSPFLTNEIALESPLKVDFESREIFKFTNEISLACKPRIVLLGKPHEITCGPIQAADNAITNLKFYSQDQGLVATMIQCAIFDKLGNLWLGTDGGLCMFDGHKWTIYTIKEGLSSNVITYLIESRDGRLVIGTDGGGLNIIDLKNQCLFNYSTKQGLVSDQIRSVLELKNGKFVIGTYDGGINVLNTENQTLTNYTTHQGLSNNVVFSLVETEDEKLIIGTGGSGLNVLDFKTKSFVHYTLADGIKRNTILCLHETKEKNLIIGTAGGGFYTCDLRFKNLLSYSEINGFKNSVVLSLIERKSGELVIGTYNEGFKVIDFANKTISKYSTNEGLSNNIVSSLLESKQGKLIIGTSGGGLNIFDNKNQNIFHYTSSQGLSNSTVYSVEENHQGELLIGTDGGGLNIFNKKKQNIFQYTSNQGLSNGIVLSVLEGKERKVFIGTDGRGLNILDLENQNEMLLNTTNGLNDDAIRCLYESRDGRLFVGTFSGGLNVIDLKSKKVNYLNSINGLSNNTILSILEGKDGEIILGTYGGGINILDFKNKQTLLFSMSQGLSNNFVLCAIHNSDGKLLVGTDGGGLNVIDLKNKKNSQYTISQGLPNDQILSLTEDSLKNIWVGTGMGLCKLKLINGVYVVEKNFDKDDGLKFMDFNTNAMTLSSNRKLWAGIGEVLTEFDPYLKIDKTPLNTYITSIDVMEKKESWLTSKQIVSNLNIKESDTIWLPASDKFCFKSNTTNDSSYFSKNNILFNEVSETIYHLPIGLVLPFSQNHLIFHYTGISIGADEDKIKYRFILDGLDEKWSSLSERMDADYRNIPAGKYIFKVASRSANGIWSSPVEFKFEVSPPWYQTVWSYLGYVFLFLISLFGFNMLRTKKLKERQIQLEETIVLRTSEVVEQKDIAEKQTQFAQHQKKLVEEKHKEITDSINYAERIQRALLASKKMLDENLNSYFILFKPKDVVSGDFYWATKTVNSNGDENFVLVTADSTGHGVPGAIMSILNIACLDKAVTKGIVSPDLILNETRSLIIENLKNDGSSEGGKDGMDGSLLSFDFKNKVLTCACANNPIWIIREKEPIEIKADRMSIGKHDNDKIPFKLQSIELQKGDLIYTLTDGFPDQFGGESGKKFKSKQLQEILISISHESMEIQKQKLADIFDKWKGNLEQVDDVCLIGIRI